MSGLAPASASDRTLFVAGNIRRFRRICEHIQSMVCAARRAPPASPRAGRRTGKGSEMSESSSCGSDTSERITDRLTDRMVSHRQVRFTTLLTLPLFLSLCCSQYRSDCQVSPSMWCYNIAGGAGQSPLSASLGARRDPILSFQGRQHDKNLNRNLFSLQ